MSGFNNLVEDPVVYKDRVDIHAGSTSAADGIYFSIEGQEFVARDKSRWRRARSKYNSDRLGSVIGQIAIADRDYVILSVEKDDRNRDPKPTDVMTRREIQVALLIADGKCDKEIARQLAISIYTVREHIRRIFAKLNVCRRTAIISQMLRK